MDKIYSRKRIRIPKLKFIYSKNKKLKKRFKLILILLIMIITVYFLSGVVTPIFDNLCVQKAISMSVDKLEGETSRTLEKYDYSNLITVTKNKDDNTNIINTDVEVLNKIVLELTVNLNKEFKNMENEKIGMPIGAFTGNRYIAAMGPKLNIQIKPSGNIETEIKTEFESKGINQTIYRIYLETKGNIKILTPYNTIGREVTNKVLLVETVIVGNVPSTYLNLDK